MSRALHVEQALAVLVDTDTAAGVAPWSDDRYASWRRALEDATAFPDATLLPVAARSYARQRHVVGGHERANIAGFAGHYRSIVAVQEASAPTPPPGPKDRPLEGAAALEAARALRASLAAARTEDPVE